MVMLRSAPWSASTGGEVCAVCVLMVAAAMLVAGAPAFTQQPAGVAVPNAGLEEGQEGPARWSWSCGEGGQGEFAWDTEHVHGGALAFRVTKVGPAGYTDLTGEPLPVEAGKTYRVAAWVYPHRNLARGVYFMINQMPVETGPEQLPNTFGRTEQPLVGGQWQELEVSVPVRQGNAWLRIHCIQAYGTPDVSWDDFSVTEVGAVPPPRYEPPVPEELPPLEPARAIVAARPRAWARVEVQNGRPRLVVEGKSVPWAFMVNPCFNPQDAHIADFRDAGVRVYCVPLILGARVYDDRGPWRGAGQYDFSAIDDLLWRVLRVDPEGYIVFYMGCDPYREWGAEHPDHVTQDQNGLKAIVDMHPKRWGDDPQPGERFGPSPASLLVRAEISETLRRLVQHVEASEPGKAVIGYHVAGFNDGQWFAWDRPLDDDLHLADYSPGAEESFREWLRRRYSGDVEALRRAWDDPQVTFETAALCPGERFWAAEGLLDPATQQDIADATRFYSEGTAETVETLAGVLKEATPRPIICGTYFEDITCNSISHIALRQHLQSSSLDYLAGPAAYGIRMAGYPGAVRSVFGSTLLHGKMFLTEQDWRSWHSAPDAPENNFEWGRAETVEAHNAMVRRECGMMLAFGLGTWWYDMTGGWFADQGIMAGIAEALRAFQRDLNVAEVPRADLAVIVSEDSNHYIAPTAGGIYRVQGVVEQVRQLNTSGVPYRLYLQSDLTRADLPDHRAYLFLNPYCISAEERRAIEALKRDGKLLVFVHAPGVVGAPDAAAAVSELVGFPVAAITEPVERGLCAEEGDRPLLAGLDGYVGARFNGPGPAFEVVGAEATPLARYGATKRVAAAARDLGTWKSIYVGQPGLSDQFVHNLAAWAGCWCVAEPGDAVYANDHFVTIHAVLPGEKVLRLHGPSRVTDLTSGEVMAERAQEVRVEMQRGETRWFAMEPG